MVNTENENGKNKLISLIRNLFRDLVEIRSTRRIEWGKKNQPYLKFK